MLPCVKTKYVTSNDLYAGHGIGTISDIYRHYLPKEGEKKVRFLSVFLLIIKRRTYATESHSGEFLKREGHPSGGSDAIAAFNRTSD